MALVEKGQDYWEYVKRRENSDTWDYLFEVWKAMKRSIQEDWMPMAYSPAG